MIFNPSLGFLVKEYNHDKIKMIKNKFKINGRRFMKSLIFYLLYYDNSYIFFWFSKLGFLQTRNAMEYILHQFCDLKTRWQQS